MKNEIAQLPVGPEEVVFAGKHMEMVHQQMDCQGEIKTFEWVRRCPGTRSIVVSPEGKILITKEYRNEFKTYDYRLPGGKTFNSLNEYNDFINSGQDMLPMAAEAAKKELVQEAGIDAIDPKHYYTSKCGTTVVWDLIYFLVDQYENLPKAQRSESGEDIKSIWLTKSEAIKLCLSGKMLEDRSVGVLLRYLLNQ